MVLALSAVVVLGSVGGSFRLCNAGANVCFDAGSGPAARGDSDATASAGANAGECLYSTANLAGGPLVEKAKVNAATRSVCVAGPSPVVAIVELPALPPSRLRLTASSARGEHVEIEWDPLSSTRLVRKIVLAPGLWTISFRGDPVRHVTETQRDLAWKLGAGFSGRIDAGANSAMQLGATEALETGRPSHTFKLSADEGKLAADGKPEPVEHEVAFRFERLPTVTRAMQVFSRREGGAAAGADHAGPRAFGLAEELSAGVAEVALVLGELVVERAKSRALRNATGDLRTELGCDTRPTPLSGEGDAGAVGSTLPGWLRLPRTCGVLASAGLDTLATSLETLRRAAQADLLESLARRVLKAPARRGTERTRPLQLLATQGLLDLVADVLDRGAVDESVAEGLIARATLAVRDAWITNVNKPREGYPLHGDGRSMGVDEIAASVIGLVFGAAAVCLAEERCDARFLAEVLDAPERHFFFEAAALSQLAAIREYVRKWPEALSVAQRLVSAVHRPTQRSPAQQLNDAISVVSELELVRRCLVPAEGEGARLNSPEELAACLHGPDNESVRLLRQALIGSVELNGVASVSALMRLVELEAPDAPIVQSRYWRAASAGMGAWSGVAPDASADAKRAATKASVNAVVDVLTDHHERRGQWVVSLSSALRFSLGTQVLTGEALERAKKANESAQAGAETPLSATYVGPSIPLGLAVELPRFASGSVGSWFGLHLDLSLIDLGRILQVGTLSPQNGLAAFDLTRLIWPQLTVGLLLGGGWALLGFTAGWQPSTQEVTVGGSLGLQVPLFDFN